jgi:hypothetical protein
MNFETASKHLLRIELFLVTKDFFETPMHIAARHGYLDQIPSAFLTRETLTVSKEYLRVQVNGKCDKAKRQRCFPERWLLLHVAKGSPFSQILGGKHKTAPGREKDVADFLAKSMHGAFSICKEAKPFDCVMLFMQDDFVAFPTSSSNPRNLPVPSKEILERGAQASDRFLDWQKDSSSVTQAA